MQIRFQVKYAVKLVVGSWLTFSCSPNKKIISTENTENCLIIDAQSGNKTNFNPKWLSQNKIQRVIEREYLKGKSSRVHLVNIFYFNREGYLQIIYNGLSNPETEYPNEKEIFSRHNYSYTRKDSFLIQTEQTVRFQDENGKLENPDTLPYPIVRALNLLKAAQFKNDQNEVLEHYQYDSSNRLVSVKLKDGSPVFTIDYGPDRKIKIKKFSSLSGEINNSWLTLNAKGLIVKNYEEDSGITFEFFYNDKGEMIEEKISVANQELYHTYEYLK